MKADLVIMNSADVIKGSLGMMPFEDFTFPQSAGSSLVLSMEETLEGYVMFRVRKRLPALILHHLCVAESYARRGVARRLVDEVARRFETQPGCPPYFSDGPLWPCLS